MQEDVITDDLVFMGLTDWVYQHQESILSAWLKQVRLANDLSVPEHTLRTWLSKYLSVFLRIMECGETPELTSQLIEATQPVLQCGMTVDESIVTMLYLSHAVETLEISQFQKGSDNENAYVTSLKDRVIHIDARIVANLIDQITKALTQQQERTATLLRVAKAASSSLDLEKVFRCISDEIVQSLGAASCNSFLFPDRSKYGNYFLLEPFPVSGYKVPDPPELFGLDALQRGEPVMCYDAALDPRTDKDTVRFFGLTSLMSFPLISNGKTIASGLIAMKDYHHFTQDEIDLVMGIASSAALAVENARFHETSMQLAIAQERNRLAQEMHDNLAQALGVIKLDINGLLQAELNDPTRATLQDLKSLVDETYIELRDTIFGLRAINETDTHFLDNFKDYLATFGAHNRLDIQISFTEEHLEVLSREAILQVGRILEEALSNVRKHSHAKRVWINGGKEENTVWITVEDDGVGMDPDNVCGCQQGHFGLQVMAERAEGVGGHIHISKRAGGGTCVRLELPYGK